MRVHLSYANVTATVALVVALGGSAVAAHDQDTIHACRAVQDGQVRIVDREADCEPGPEEALTWSRRGPAGAQGPQGAPGPQGPQGPAGTPAPPVAASAETLVVGPRAIAALERSFARVSRARASFQRNDDLRRLVSSLSHTRGDAARQEAMARATRITRMMTEMLRALEQTRRDVISNLGP